MKRFLSALLLIPALALGAGNDLLINQRNPADTATLTRAVVPPSGGGVDGIMGYAGGSNLPVFYRFGAGLALNSGAVVALPQAWADITGKPILSTVATTGAYGDLSGVPGTFTPAPHVHAAGDVTSGTLAAARLPALTISQTTGLQAALDSKYPAPTGSAAQYLRGDGSLAAFPAIHGGTVTSVTAGTGLAGGTITSSGTISMPNTGTPGSYANVTTDAQGRVTAGTNRSQAAATRSLNTAFQVSATRDAWVSYSVQITVTASIAGGQNGDVILEIASDSGFTANVQALSISGLGQTYTLAIALQGVQPQTGVVNGYIPAGYYARLRTVSVTGTPAFSYRAGQEVLQ